MSARPDTWMPMYWGDYARDTGHLNAAGHGAYLMLIKHYWCTGEPLINDDEDLWRIACCDSKKDWLRLRPKIVRLFIEDNGTLRHKRIDRELEAAVSSVSAKAEAGRKGARNRWQKDGSAMAVPLAEPMADGESANGKRDGKTMPNQCDRHPFANAPSPKEVSKEESKSLALSVTELARENGGRHPANGAGPPRWGDRRIVPCGLDRDKADDHPDNIRDRDRPMCNGSFVDWLVDQLQEITGIHAIPIADKTMIQWLADGYEPDAILAAIRRVVERPDFTPKPLSYFDKPVREQPPTWHPLPSPAARRVA